MENHLLSTQSLTVAYYSMLGTRIYNLVYFYIEEHHPRRHVDLSLLALVKRSVSIKMRVYGHDGLRIYLHRMLRKHQGCLYSQSPKEETPPQRLPTDVRPEPQRPNAPLP